MAMAGATKVALEATKVVLEATKVVLEATKVVILAVIAGLKGMGTAPAAR